MHSLRSSSSSTSLTGRRQAPATAARTRRSTTTKTSALKDNVARLTPEFPPETMQKVVVRDAAGAEVVTIPNAEGKRASLVFYAAVASTRQGGALDAAAADELLTLYDEVVADAVAHRGSHPNIDLLLDVKSGAIKGPLRIEVVKA